MTNDNFPEFRPHSLLRSPHLQTVVATYLRSQPITYDAVQHDVPLDNGDLLVLHDDCPNDWRPGDRVALLIHGLGGSHLSNYMVRSAKKLNEAGVRTFRKDLRGHGAGYAKSRDFGHAGKSEDVADTIHFIRNLCPLSPITIVGFSLGGNIVLKYLGELEDAVPDCVDRVLTIAPPIDLLHCGQNLREGINRYYDTAFVRSLHELATRRHREVSSLKPISTRQLPKRLWDFDDQYTAPMSGFAGIEDYYARCSAARFLPSIRTPTTILTSADDPLVPVAMYYRHPMSSAITLHITTHGGHLGFISTGEVDPDRRWMDWRVVDFATQTDRRFIPLNVTNSCESR